MILPELLRRAPKSSRAGFVPSEFFTNAVKESMDKFLEYSVFSLISFFQKNEEDKIQKRSLKSSVGFVDGEKYNTLSLMTLPILTCGMTSRR